MRNISFRIALLLVLCLSVFFTFCFYSQIILNPNQYLFSATGDGISSYYNSIYHIENDSSYLSFEGMNYPFGEHLTYSINNPLLTNIIKFLKEFFPGISNYTVGIFNFSMLLSFLLTAIFLFLIFEEFQINRILSILSAIGIVALSPQVFRMLGHLSLAYSFAIPLYLWIIIKSYKNKNKVKWYIFLFINQILWIFIHAYYGAIMASFIICFVLLEFLFNRNTFKNKVFYNIFLITIFILPIILYKLFLIYTDNHQYRTDNPYGFLEFISSLRSIFIPHHPPIKPLIDKLVTIDQEWEGWSYIGLSSIITIILIGIYIIRQKIKFHIKVRDNRLLDNALLNTLFLAAIILMLYSMGLPFKFIPGYLPKPFGFLREFRVLGRFAWVFYFVSSIFCTCAINKYLIYLNSKNKKITLYLIVGFYSGLFIIEAVSYHNEVSNTIKLTPNYFVTDKIPDIYTAIEKINLSEYQAILPLPFYHRGSENFSKSPSNKSLLYSELFSYKCSLPLLSSYLARTSIYESKLLMQILSPTIYEKPIVKIFTTHRSFLVIYTKESLSDNENELLKRSEKLMDFKDFCIYRIKFDSLFLRNHGTNTLKNKILIHEGFDSVKCSVAYKGGGALTGKMSQFSTIYDFNPDLFQSGQKYLISFWMYNCGNNCGQDMLNSIVFINYENIAGEKEWLSMVNPANSETIDGCWSKVVLNLYIKPSNNKTSQLKLMIKGNDFLENNFIIDELGVTKN
jgi:hypothetical protein